MENSVKELLKALSEKSELLKDLESLWKDGDAKKITAFIEKAGIKTDIETVEKALAEFQKKTVEKIQNGKIDDNQLEAVNGGGMGFCEGTADCDEYFNSHPELTDRCYLSSYCDEFFRDLSDDEEQEKDSCHRIMR